MGNGVPAVPGDSHFDDTLRLDFEKGLQVSSPAIIGGMITESRLMLFRILAAYKPFGPAELSVIKTGVPLKAAPANHHQMKFATEPSCKVFRFKVAHNRRIHCAWWYFVDGSQLRYWFSNQKGHDFRIW